MSALAIPILLALLGKGVQYKETKKGFKRSRAEREIGRDKLRGVQKSRRKNILDAVQEYDPTARQGKLDVAAGEAETRISDLLSEARAGATTTGGAGKISTKSLAQQGQSTRNRANNASILAALLSKVQAPNIAGSEEATGRLELASEIGGLDRRGNRIGRTAETLAGLEGQLNPKTMLAGGFAEQLGLSLASANILKGLTPPGTVSPSGGTLTPISIFD